MIHRELWAASDGGRRRECGISIWVCDLRGTSRWSMVLFIVPSSASAHVAAGALGEGREGGAFPTESRASRCDDARRAPLASKDILTRRVGASPVGRRSAR